MPCGISVKQGNRELVDLAIGSEAASIILGKVTSRGDAGLFSHPYPLSLYLLSLSLPLSPTLHLHTIEPLSAPVHLLSEIRQEGGEFRVNSSIRPTDNALHRTCIAASGASPQMSISREVPHAEPPSIKYGRSPIIFIFLVALNAKVVRLQVVNVSLLLEMATCRLENLPAGLSAMHQFPRRHVRSVGGNFRIY